LKAGCAACIIIIIIKMYAVYAASEPTFPSYLAGSVAVMPIKRETMAAHRRHKVSTPSFEADAVGVLRGLV
jgi:hypothetical protein